MRISWEIGQLSQNDENEALAQGVNRRQFLKTALLGTSAVALTELMPAGGLPGKPVVASPASSSAWSFGVMADTQWVESDDGADPNSVAVEIINQINRQFIPVPSNAQGFPAIRSSPRR